MSRDFQYREDVSRLNATNEDWVRELPIGDMIGFGWLRPVPRPSDEVNACLRFFDVPTVSAWHQKYSGVETAVALRTSQSFESRPASIAAWIRQGEIAAEDNICRSWDAERFEDSLSAIRSLAQKKNPEMFHSSIAGILRRRRRRGSGSPRSERLSGEWGRKIDSLVKTRFEEVPAL